MPAEVPVTPSVLTWARVQAGMSVADLAQRLRVEASDVDNWETGDARPTKGQFTKLVKALRRPSAIFFLPEPPADAAEVPPNLRRSPEGDERELSTEEYRRLRWARRLQRIVSWSIADRDDESVELPQVDARSNPDNAAVEFRRILNVAASTQLEWRSTNEAFREWRAVLEDHRILVLQLSLGKAGCRGLSVWDPYAPLIAVNTAYSPAVRVFTLFHEVGHLLLRSDSACVTFDDVGPAASRIERWCERFAAAVLLPADAVRELASQRGISTASKTDDPYDARWLANRFNVSVRASALRLTELGLGASGLYEAVQSEFSNSDWNSGGGGGGGQPAVEKRVGQLGSRVPSLLLDAVSAGRLTTADAAEYLKLTTNQLDDLRSMVSTR